MEITCSNSILFIEEPFFILFISQLYLQLFILFYLSNLNELEINYFLLIAFWSSSEKRTDSNCGKLTLSFEFSYIGSGFSIIICIILCIANFRQ